VSLDFQRDTIVVTKIELSQAAVQVLRFAVLIYTSRAALEDREHALHGVGVHMAASVLLAPVVHGFVALVVLANLAELLVFVGDQVRASIQVIAERLFDVEEVLPSYMGGLHFAVTLSQSKNGVLLALARIATLASLRAST